MDDLFYAERTARLLGRQWLREHGLTGPDGRPIAPPGAAAGRSLRRALGARLVRLGERLLAAGGPSTPAGLGATPAEA